MTSILAWRSLGDLGFVFRTMAIQISIASVTLVLIGGCGPERLAETSHVPRRCAIVFFVDGLDQTHLNEQLAEGALPHMQRVFVDGGVWIERPVVSLPAITYPNTVSLLTGRFPGYHGILGNRWFDRRTLVLRDYGSASTFQRVNDDFDVPTLYEWLPEHFTVSIQCHTRRGVTHTIDNSITSGLDWLFGAHASVDQRTGASFTEVIELARRRRRWPSVVWHYFPGVDEIGHRSGPDSPRYRDAVANVDAQVGHVADAVRRTGFVDRTYFVLVTDHGQVPVHPQRTVDLVRWLRESCGLRVREQPIDGGNVASRGARLQGYDAVVINGVYRRLAIHLRGRRGWGDPPDDERIKQVLQPKPTQIDDRLRLVDQPGVGLVCTRAGPNAVDVIGRDSSARIERRGNGWNAEYRIVNHAASSVDPFAYHESIAASNFVSSEWHTSRRWLEATTDTDYPDFVPQIVEMFDSPRAGDIVVFARDDWSFSRRDRGGHGSCLARDMLGVLAFAGPDLPAASRLPHARIVDVVPTLLELLGECDQLGARDVFDGISLAPQLRGGESVATFP